MKYLKIMIVAASLLSSPSNSTKSYEWILFDADETLFKFDVLRGLKELFSRREVVFTLDNFKEFQSLNKALWAEYQKGTIGAKDLQTKRFEGWASKLEISAESLNHEFLMVMAEISEPLPGALELLTTLKERNKKIGLITNGFTALQQPRLQRTGFTDFFDVLVVSEEVGFAKPHKAIFEHAFSCMGQPKAEEVLMVGDTLDSDIQGGINAGIDTCWFNARSVSISSDIKPKYTISSLPELQMMLIDMESGPEFFSE